MRKKVIQTEKAPKAIGPYSQAIQAGNLIFISGQIPLDPATGERVKGDIRQQTEQVLENIRGGIGVSKVRNGRCHKSDYLFKGYGRLQSCE